MRAQVLNLRRCGAKLALPRPGTEWRIGVLRLVRVGRGDGVRTIELAQLASTPGIGVVATLYEPIVEGVDDASFRLRGVKRVGGAGTSVGLVQEWLVDIKSPDWPGARPA